MRTEDFEIGKKVWIPRMAKFATVSGFPHKLNGLFDFVEVAFDDGTAAVVPTIECREKMVVSAKYKDLVVFD